MCKSICSHPSFYCMLADLLHLCSSEHKSAPPSGVERMAMNEWCMKPALYSETHCTKTWQCGHTLLHTFPQFIRPQLTLTLQQFNSHLCLPFSRLRKQWGTDQRNPTWQEAVEWLQRRRRGKQTNSRRGRRAKTLDKCPPDVVGFFPTLHLMASCASTLPVGVICWQCFHSMLY